MTRDVRIHADAAEELAAAVRWYEERRAGLGQQLLLAVDAVVERISRWPGAGSPVSGLSLDVTVRRAPLARFPYDVVYFEADEVIRIIAFAHHRRRPGYWKHRTS